LFAAGDVNGSHGGQRVARLKSNGEAAHQSEQSIVVNVVAKEIDRHAIRPEGGGRSPGYGFCEARKATHPAKSPWLLRNDYWAIEARKYILEVLWLPSPVSDGRSELGQKLT